MTAHVGYRINNLEALNSLTAREKQVLEMRLGVGEYTRQHTLQEISKVIITEWGGKYKDKPVQRERIRQIEATALRKLRHPNRNGGVEYI